MIIPDFRNSGGTLTYFKQILKLLEGYSELDIEVFLKPSQLDIVGQFFGERESKLNWSTYRTPEFRFSKFLGNRLNYYLEFAVRCIFWAYYCATRRPWLIIHSTGGELHYPFFILPVNFLAIQHSLQLRQLSRLNRSILNVFLGDKKRILTVSQFFEQCIVEAGLIRDKKKSYVGHVYNCHPDVKPAPGKNRTTFTVLTIGHVVEYKNPKFWLEVAKDIPNRCGIPVKFLWAGSGEQLDLYRLRCSNYENIVFLGHCDNVDELYSNCDLYFQPSLLESHGIAVLGAMAHGLPCVVSDVGGLPESVIDEETGFVYRSGDLNAACESIKLVAENAATSRELGNQGHKRFRDVFASTKWKAKMKHFLDANYGIV